MFPACGKIWQDKLDKAADGMVYSTVLDRFNLPTATYNGLNFSKHMLQFVSTLLWNKTGTRSCMMNMHMVSHVMLEIKYGYTVQLYQEDIARSYIDPGKDHSLL